MNMSVGITASTVLATVALLLAPAAGADDQSGFLGDLAIDQATLPGKTPDEMIAAGYATCRHLESGTSELDEIDAVNQAYGFDRGIDFVGVARAYLC